MKLTIFIIAVLLLFSFVNIIPTAEAGVFVNLSSYLQAGFDSSNFSAKPIVPRSELRSLTMYFDFGVNCGGLFKNLAQLLLQYHKNRQINIKLELSDYSPWCTPTLLTDTITTKIGEVEENGFQVTLNLRLDLDAPAYASGFVEVKATVPKVGMIQGYSNTYTLEFNPAYLPLISFKFPEGNNFIIAPYNETVIPIDIENLGNGNTYVRAEIVNASENWNVSVSNVIVEVGDTVRTYLNVSADHKFDTESIMVEFTPERAEDPTDAGSPQFIKFIFENDGSYKNIEEGSEIDITLLLLLIIAILIIIIVIIIKKTR